MGLSAKDAELVRIMDAVLNDAANRAGAWLVCRLGCTQCCHGAFAINALDAQRLRAGMDALQVSDPALASRIKARAQAWIDEHGPAFPGDRLTGAVGQSDADRERFEDFANDAACPALDPATGSCDVYVWRPMTCRVFGPPVRMESGLESESGISETNAAEANGSRLSSDVAALGHCELCFVGASEDVVKACELEIPHELEAQVLAEVGDATETVVAYALLR